ncbi:outer membrane beta-barrel protein [Rhodoferax saidenbachensis]|uniref:Opacity protein-like surface antigen n=1 Tax=Rhodoferax saidenbachensis TaxID=1484693 RepID=A0ABU1ZMF4_9BURK|nr:outer membrane beta-barrel protein [Rhodoferax saidenbachensis]MDR7306720.1 opacity protein-like surface antigen [Rhodoferax saidenbachensis]
MKKILIAAAVTVATLGAPQAFAQAKNFEGFSVGLNINSTASDTDISNSGGSVKATGQTSANGAFQVQYNLPLGSSFVLGFGGTYEFGDIDIGSSAIFSGKRKEASSVYIAPGFAINDSWLIYGKVASISAKFESTGAAIFTGKADATGMGYGLGFQKMLGKNLYLQAEYMQNKYNDQTIVTSLTTQAKAEARTVSFGVGYKF